MANITIQSDRGSISLKISDDRQEVLKMVNKALDVLFADRRFKVICDKNPIYPLPKITLIKCYRTMFGSSLKDAKEWADKLLDNQESEKEICISNNLSREETNKWRSVLSQEGLQIQIKETTNV